jgi:hypothetical protein
LCSFIELLRKNTSATKIRMEKQASEQAKQENDDYQQHFSKELLSTISCNNITTLPKGCVSFWHFL